MTTDKTNTNKTDRQTKLLYPNLSYQLRGIFFTVTNQYGLGHKERLYHQSLIDQFHEQKILFDHEKQISIYSWRDGRKIATYIPDFIIDNKILLELKSEPFLSKQFLNQIYSYLRVSEYELAFIVNFGEENLKIKRLLFTNDRKPQIKRKST